MSNALWSFALLTKSPKCELERRKKQRQQKHARPYLLVAQTHKDSDVQTCHTLLIRTASLRPINNLLLCQETKFPLNFHFWTRQVSALSPFPASLTQQHTHVVHAFRMLKLGPLPSAHPPTSSRAQPAPPRDELEDVAAALSGNAVPFLVFILFAFFFFCARHIHAIPHRGVNI